MVSLIMQQKQNMQVLVPLLDSGTFHRFWKQIVQCRAAKEVVLTVAYCTEGRQSFLRTEIAPEPPWHLKSGCGERSMPPSPREPRAHSRTSFSAQQCGASPRGLIRTSFLLYQFFSSSLCLNSEFYPWKMLKARLKFVYLCWLSSEVITEFLELFLNMGHARDVSVTGRFSAGGGNYRQLASQSNWLVALFLNHLLSCVDRAVLAWKRFFFFYSHPAQSLHHFTLWVIPIIVNHPLTFLRIDVLPSLWSKQTPCLISLLILRWALP